MTALFAAFIHYHYNETLVHQTIAEVSKLCFHLNLKCTSKSPSPSLLPSHLPHRRTSLPQQHQTQPATHTHNIFDVYLGKILSRTSTSSSIHPCAQTSPSSLVWPAQPWQASSPVRALPQPRLSLLFSPTLPPLLLQSLHMPHMLTAAQASPPAPPRLQTPASA